ncbi:MAG: alpha/beta fold hydrolase [Actinomycetales bacterium]|nr:alpha/beta hydrolase [Leifsonia sp.]
MTSHTSLLLHGGGGPATVIALGAHLAESSALVAPTHPGWNGTERPAELDSVAALADYYSAFLERENLTNLVVVGSSIGGWIGAELALRDTAHRIAGLILINSGGVDVAGEPITNVSGMTPQELAAVSFHDASKLPPRPAPTPEALAILAGNAAALDAYAGDPYMHDPTLLGRLSAIDVPTLVIWGESDGVFSVEFGRAFAAAIPGARFVTVAEAGHLPWIEEPSPVFAAIDEFTESLANAS